jgi:hypothetical protein
MSLLALRQFIAEPSGTGTVLTIGGKFAVVCNQTQEAAGVEGDTEKIIYPKFRN